MVRFLATLVFAAAAFALSGCYESQYLLLDSSAPATPVSSGIYTRASDTRYVSQQSDGWYLYGTTTHNQTSKLLLNRAGHLGDNVYYFAAQPGPGTWNYGLVVVSGSALYVIRPECSLDNGIAASEGARYATPEGGAYCSFSDSGQVRRALDRYFRANGWGDPYYRR